MCTELCKTGKLATVYTYLFRTQKSAQTEIVHKVQYTPVNWNCMKAGEH